MPSGQESQPELRAPAGGKEKPSVQKNQQELRAIVRGIVRKKGFQLLFVSYDWDYLRDEYTDFLREELAAEALVLHEVRIEETIGDFVAFLKNLNAVPEDRVVCLFHLEKSILASDSFAARLNLSRDLLPEAFPRSLVIWLPPDALGRLARKAPDFWSWRANVAHLEMSEQERAAQSIPNSVRSIAAGFVKNELEMEKLKSEGLFHILQSVLSSSFAKELLAANDHALYSKLVHIAFDAAGQTLDDIKPPAAFFEDLRLRLKRFAERQSDADVASASDHHFGYSLLFPPVVEVRRLVTEILIAAGVADELLDRFLRHYNASCLEEFTKQEWASFFESKSVEKQEKNLLLYLERLRSFPERPLHPGEPNLQDVFIAPRAFLLHAEQFGVFDISEDAPAIEDISGFIENYFELEPSPGHPSYRDNHGHLRLLFIASHAGTGKSVLLKELAARWAARFLATREGPIPVFVELNEFAAESFKLESYLEGSENLMLDPALPYLFLLDGLDQSGPPSTKHYNRMIDEIKNLLVDRFRNSSAVITTRPIFGPNGVLAGRMKTLCERFLYLDFFDEERANAYIARRIALDDSLPRELDFAFINEYLLKGSDESRHPLLLNIVLDMFRQGVLSANKLQNKGPTLSKTELFLFFVQRWSTRSFFSADAFKENRHVFRYFLRLISARILMNKMLPRDGTRVVDLPRFIENLNQRDRELYKLIEQYRPEAASYFSQQGDHIEFTHLSFQEFFTAEYLLERLLLNSVNHVAKHELHIGYASNMTLGFFGDLLIMLRSCLEDPGAPKWTELFKELFLSIQTGSDSALDRFLEEDGNLRISQADLLRQQLFDKALVWAQDETMLFSGKSDVHEFLGNTIYASPTNPALNHTYCERWYCVLLLHVFNTEGIRLSIGWESLLRGSLSSQYFNRRLLRYCSFADLRGADLSRLDLSAAVLDHADLRGANLSGSLIDARWRSMIVTQEADVEGVHWKE